MNLGMLVLARILQGAGGGALQPISQAILLESFPKEKRGLAMVIFGLGAVVAPIIGPVMGGWITDNYTWRWVFYINIPVGILAILLATIIIQDPPYIKAHKGASVDTIGFGFLTIWLASFQIVLDKGQDADWFEARWICVMSVISVLSMIAFIIRELTTEHPIVDLRILKNRNFSTGTFLIGIFGFIIYAIMSLLPMFLQNVMGYNALSSGLASSPIGIGALVAFFIAGAIMGHIDGRMIAFIGYGILTIGCYLLSNLNLEMSQSSFLWPTIVCGMSLGLIFPSMSTMTMGTLTNEQMANATGLFNLARNLGGSIGISYVTTMLSRGAQSHQGILISHLTPYDSAYQHWMENLKNSFSILSSPGVALQQAYAAIYSILVEQATLLANVDNFRTLAFFAFLCMLSIGLFKKVSGNRPVLAH
jgi:DHA2 family multidrug resistance protein